MKNPQSCPICRAHWDFKLDSLARVIAVHPITKCISPAAVYEKEDEEASWERRCIECERLFKPRTACGQSELCGAKCRKARNRRAAREWYEKKRRAA